MRRTSKGVVHRVVTYLYGPVGVFLLALGVRIAWVLRSHITPISDFAGYEQLALRLLREKSFGTSLGLAYRTPGYPAFLAAVFLAAGHSTRAVGLAQAVIGSGTAALVAAVGARLSGRSAGVTAGCLQALLVPSILYTPVLASETLAAFLMIASVWGLTCVPLAGGIAWKRSLVVALACGAVVGLLLLVRPASVFAVPGLAGATAISTNTIRRWHRVAVAGALAMGVLCTLAPWLVRNGRLGLGWLTLSTAGGVNVAMANNSRNRRGDYLASEALERYKFADEVAWDRANRRKATQWILAHPERYIALSRVRLCRLLGTVPDLWAARYLIPDRRTDELVVAARQSRASDEPDERIVEAEYAVTTARGRVLQVLRVPLVPLTLVGLALGLLRMRRFAVIVLPWASYVLGISLTFAEPRFRELSEPLLMVMTGVLLATIGGAAQDFPEARKRAALAVVSALAVAVCAVVHVAGLERPLYVLP